MHGMTRGNGDLGPPLENPENFRFWKFRTKEDRGLSTLIQPLVFDWFGQPMVFNYSLRPFYYTKTNTRTNPPRLPRPSTRKTRKELHQSLLQYSMHKLIEISLRKILKDENILTTLRVLVITFNWRLTSSSLSKKIATIKNPTLSTPFTINLGTLTKKLHTIAAPNSKKNAEKNRTGTDTKVPVSSLKLKFLIS